MDKIKWGIIGPGRIARDFASDMDLVTNGELHAVASRSSGRASDFASEFNIPKIYNSYEDLFADVEIDAVYVATTHNFHLENSTEALQAGKAVLCEKPLTVDPDECRQLTDVARSTGCYLMEGMWTYFLPAIRKAKEWVEAGKIGNVKHIKAEFGFKKPFDPESRLYNPELAGGVILDMGIYPIAFAWYFLQATPEKMEVVRRNAPTGVDEEVVMQFRYPEATASLITSFRYKLPNYAYVIGDEGYIVVPDFWRSKESLLYIGEECVEHFKDPSKGRGFNFEIEAAGNDIISGMKESEIMPLSSSFALQEHMQSVLAADV